MAKKSGVIKSRSKSKRPTLTAELAKTTLDHAAEYANALRVCGDEDSPEDFILQEKALQEAIAQITDIAEQVSYIESEEQNQLAELKDQLLALGSPPKLAAHRRAWNTAKFIRSNR